jgi:CPA1 family monovalent cation:H+ antiporter
MKVRADIQVGMTRETLFNDGVGVVLFAVLLQVAVSSSIDTLHVTEMLFVEVLGGAALGGVTGFIAYRAMRAIDDYPIEVLISLARVVGDYAVASKLHMGGPLAVVVAGLLIASRGRGDALSEQIQAISPASGR